MQVLAGPDRKTWTTLLQSSVARNTQNPIWDIDEISMQKLSDGDYNRVVRIQIMSLPAGGGHPQDIGGVAMSVNELLRIPNTYEVLRAIKEGGKQAGRDTACCDRRYIESAKHGRLHYWWV